MINERAAIQREGLGNALRGGVIPRNEDCEGHDRIAVAERRQ